MATWKKVVVSGSSAELATLKVDNLTSGQVVIGGGSAGNLTTTAINGTGNIVATTNATGLVHTGSFSGSFAGTITSASYATFAATATSASFSTQAANASSASYALSASYATASSVAISASFATTAANASSASYALTASYVANAGSTANALTFSTGLSGSAISFNGATAVSLAISGASALSSNVISKWAGAGFVNTNITDTGTQIQIGSGASSGLNVAAGGINVTGTSTFNNNLTVGGDLIVNGTASFVNSDNLYVKDRFILINSGSSALADAGIIAQYEASGNGSAIFLEAASAGTYGRWAVAYGVAPTATSVTADEYMVSAKINQASAPSAAPTWGGSTNGTGNIWVTNAGDIYIYS